MLKFNLEGVTNDELSLLDLVIVERNRYNKPFLNINGYDEKLKLVTYQMEKDFCESICNEYNTWDELQESEELCLIMTYLIEKGLTYLDSDEVLENVKMFDNLINGISYTITNDLMLLFEEIEEQ